MAETQSRLESLTFGERDCSDPVITGQASNRYDFVQKYSRDDTQLDDIIDLDLKPQCVPWYYYNVRFGNIDVIVNLEAGGNIQAGGNVTSNGGSHVLSAKKNFDIPHPKKHGWRLRHTCIEGPENAVYFRGKTCLIESWEESFGIIYLPDYWKNFVNYETITVNLTPIKHNVIWVNLIDKERNIIEIGSKFPGEFYYHVYVERKDGEKLIVEYEGESPEDYPGNNDEYSISGYHYDRKNK